MSTYASFWRVRFISDERALRKWYFRTSGALLRRDAAITKLKIISREDTIRENLANSFAHAIYNGRTTHEICIHPDMITIYSPGEYASRYTPEEYIKGNIESEIRNAVISKILYLNRSIEQFGSGCKRIHSLCGDGAVPDTAAPVTGIILDI